MKTARCIVQSVAGYKLAHAFYKLNSDPFLNSDHMSEWKKLVYAGNRLTFSARCLCSRSANNERLFYFTSMCTDQYL